MSTYLDEFQIDLKDHSYQLHPDSTLDHQGGREDTGRRGLDETIPCRVEEGAGILGGLEFHAWVYTTADGRVERDLYPLDNPLGRKFGSDKGEESFLEKLIVRSPEPEEEVLFLANEELERYPANGYKWMHSNPEIKRKFDGTILDRTTLNRFVSYEGLEITVAEDEIGIHIDTTVVPKVHGDNSQIDSLDLIVYETENARLVSCGTAVKIELKVSAKNRINQLKTSNPGEYLDWEGNLNLHTITQRVWEAQKESRNLTSAEKDEFDRKLLEYAVHLNIPFLAKLPDQVLKRMFKTERSERTSLEDKLSEIGLPESDVQEIAKVARDVDLRGIDLVTLSTFSSSVVKSNIKIEGEEFPIYCKVGNKRLQKQQAQYLRDAGEIGILRAIHPKLFAYVESENGQAAIQITHDTKDRRIVSPEDMKEYLELRQETFSYLARTLKTSPSRISQDSLLTDCFNVALSHTYMRHHLRDSVYQPELSFMDPGENLEAIQRLAKRETQVRSFLRTYRSIEPEVSAYLQSPSVLMIGDYREENIFNDSMGGLVRPIGDPMPRPGVEIGDWSRRNLNPETVRKAVEYTALIRNYLEQRKGVDFEFSGADIRQQQEEIIKLSFIQSVFLADYFCGKRRNADCRSQLQKAQSYYSQIRSPN